MGGMATGVMDGLGGGPGPAAVRRLVGDGDGLCGAGDVPGWFADRNLSWVGAWRLASAALMPGALLMAAAVFSYAWHTIDLLGLSFFFTAHLIIGWVYLVGGVCAAPRLFPRNTKQNPFAS